MKKAVLFLAAVIALTGLCGCDKSESQSNGDKNSSQIGGGIEGYFGGTGKLYAPNPDDDSVFRDDSNIYFRTGFGFDGQILKLNKKTNILSVACQIPGCTHTDVSCKANLSVVDGYLMFNGNLLKWLDDTAQNADGTFTSTGCLYLCRESDKLVFANKYPEEMSEEDRKNRSLSIGPVYALGDNYLAVWSSACVYILDADFNIKYTVLDAGAYSGGMYCIDNEIYYIDKLFRLIKINAETGEHSVVELDSMKLTEGRVIDKTLWFSNEEQLICSYNFQTKEVKKRAERGVRMDNIGKYISYMEWTDGNGAGDLHLLDVESGVTREWSGVDKDIDTVFFTGEEYYIYSDGILTQYDEDLTSVLNTYALAD